MEYSTSNGWLSEVGKPSRFAIWLYFCCSSRTRFSALANSMATAGLYPRAKSPRFVSTNCASFSSINLNVLRRSNSTTRCCSCCAQQTKNSVTKKKKQANKHKDRIGGVYGLQGIRCGYNRYKVSLVFHTSNVIQQTNQCSSSQWRLSSAIR